MPETAVIYATFPNAETALAAANRLLEAGSIACANVIGGVTSVYRWEGQVHQDPEVILIAKTDASRVNAAIESIAEDHPYDCPCVTSWPIGEGFAPYLQWIVDSTAPSGPGHADQE